MCLEECKNKRDFVYQFIPPTMTNGRSILFLEYMIYAVLHGRYALQNFLLHPNLLQRDGPNDLTRKS